MPYEKVGKNEPVCIADEVPFDIPESWEWVRISGVFSVINGDRGKNYPAKSTLSNTGIPFISAVNLDGKTVIEDDNLLCLSDEQFNKLGSGKLEKDDVVVCIRGSLGKHGRYPFEKGAIASSLVILRPHLNISLLSDFIMMYLDSPLFFSEIKRYDNGTAQPNLAAKSLEMFFLPLPPLPEQKRIVEKLNEVSSLTDNYAEAYVRVAELNQKFPELLKKSILQEAVQGKLVPQNPNDEPAYVLLERIRDEKEQLIKAGKIKRDKHESVIFRRNNSHYEIVDGEERCIDDEIPFEIPDSWMWCRLSSVGITQTGNTPSKAHLEYVGDEIPFITPGDIQSGQIFYDNQALSSEGKMVSRVCSKESILQVCIGGSIGKAAITNREVCFNQQINTISPIIVCSEYIYTIMQSPYFVQSMKKQAGGTATPIINRRLWDSLFIPIAPLFEQRRIVEKQQELFDKITLI